MAEYITTVTHEISKYDRSYKQAISLHFTFTNRLNVWKTCTYGMFVEEPRCNPRTIATCWPVYDILSSEVALITRNVVHGLPAFVRRGQTRACIAGPSKSFDCVNNFA